MNYHPGLENIVAAQTKLSRVDGQKGELIIGGYPLESIALYATFEEMVFLLWHGRKAEPNELVAFDRQLKSYRAIPAITIDLLAAAAAEKLDPMDALRMAAGSFALDFDRADDNLHTAAMVLARMPTALAAYWRLQNQQEPLEPHPDLGHAANFLYMLNGTTPTPSQTAGLNTYLNTVVDHGLNASTFAARVIVATQSDLVSAVTGAIGALKGPLHGGAPGPALDTVLEIGTIERVEPVLRAKLAAGERLMGFGHRVYKVRDPRADVLGTAAKKLFTDDQQELYQLAMAVEKTAIELLEEAKPGRNLKTNVEFFTALLLHGLGLHSDLFAPTFALSRTAGWLAHCFEQQTHGRLIRPRAEYIGPLYDAWAADPALA